MMASVLILVLYVSGSMAQTTAPQEQRPKVQAGTTNIVVDKVEIASEFRQILNLDPPYSPPVVRPTRKENHFVFVYVTAEFPKAKSWNLMDFCLRDEKKREYQVVAFDIGDVLSHGLIYTFENGALAIADAERAGKGIADHLQDRSGTMKPKPGKVNFLGEWPGGNGKLVLGFDVPNSATDFTLLRKSGTLPPKSLRNDERPKESLLPPYTDELTGGNPVRVRNQNDFSVTAAIRSGQRGKNLNIPANGVNAVHIPDGKYDIYFVYSDKPDALFQGDSFTLNNNGVEIQIVKVVNGNYGIRQVK
jgi:hypothetical protein